MTQPATPHSDAIPRQRRDLPSWIAVAILIVAIAAALGPIAPSGFSYWDDEDTISLSPRLNPPTWAGLAERWSRPHLHIYVPLTHTVWHMVALVSPAAPAGTVGNFAAWPFKLTSLAAHAVSSVLVLMILRRVAGQSWITLAGAIAFAVHPIQVETVAWTSGLKDLLFGMFSAGCVLAYIGTGADRARPRGRSIVIALVLLVLAGLSKPTAMVVPLMLLALDLTALRRPLGQSLARLLPFAVVGLAFAAYAMTVQPAASQALRAPVALRPLVAIDSIAFYATKLIVPLNLAYDYGRNASVAIADARAAPLRIAAKAVLVVALIAIALLARRRAPLVTLGLLWAAIPLGPVLGLTYFDFAHYSTVADHYAYLPMLGVALLLAGVLERVRRDRVALPVIAACLVACAILAFRQSLTWRDARSVTMQTLRVNDRSQASWSNLALAELRAGRMSEAEANARRSVSLAPSDPQSLFVLANVLQERGDDAGALTLVREAARLSPYTAAYHHRLATLLGKAGRLVEAMEALDRALVLDPEYPGAAAQRKQLAAFLKAHPPATAPAATTQP